MYKNWYNAPLFLENVTFASSPVKFNMLETNAYVDVAEPKPLLFDILVGNWSRPTRAPDNYGGQDFCVNIF